MIVIKEFFINLTYFVLKTLGFALAFTLLAQFIEWNGLNFENHYHIWINEDRVQNVIFELKRPLGMATHKLGEIMPIDSYVNKVQENIQNFKETFHPENLGPEKMKQMKQEINERNKMLKKLDDEVPE